ncbi:MAG TPA: tryptophan 7-halogenase [Rhodospirillaceae bacterium]|nr:tryptophan halogenase [Rhodospirillaceae bacterium]HAA91719.1 tryptophan 7-halogenase [Rhodospirillaceae bacterium]HAT34155.1 tryptophan 7-halogenase [Rhodospirillaceae bacterium]
MGEPISKVTIVGGGTAGWMAATHLVTRLNSRAEIPIEVCLIESPNIPTVGVGEATVPTMKRWFESLDLDEAAFITHCNASFKLGVRFVNWDHDINGNPLNYIHPFDGFGDDIQGYNPAYYFHKFNDPGGGSNYSIYHSPITAVVEGRKGPKPLEAENFESVLNYAYHLDAGLFAQYLRQIAIERGVIHILDDVEEIELDEKGYVSSLQLKQQGRHEIELVIDCTGFKSMILQQTLGVEFENYGQYLLNDRALAVQLPHLEPTKLEPCTRSTALGAGWSWRVPLYSRIGTGYVFSSAHRNDEEATAEFLDHLGPLGKGAEPRAIGMKVGRARQTWAKNCIAIGLSGGFIEPLESTAIYLVDRALGWIVEYFPDKDFNPILSDRYNRLSESLYTEIRDFIVLHYCTNTREDSDYWKAAREDITIPDSLKEKLELFKHALPTEDELDSGFLFSGLSYLIVLFGKGFFKDVTFPADRAISASDWERYQNVLHGVTAELITNLPDHHQLLSSIRASRGGDSDTRELSEAIEKAAQNKPVVALPDQALEPEISFAGVADEAGGNIL